MQNAFAGKISHSAPCKALVLSGCESRPATGSLRPEAIGAAAEATKPSKPSVERVPWGPRKPAGPSASERRAGLETFNAGADPPAPRGRPMPRGGERATEPAWSCRGRGGGMPERGNRRQHGKPVAVAARDGQPAAREGRAGPRRAAERPVVPTTPRNGGRGKGPQLKASAGSGDGRGIGDGLHGWRFLVLSFPPREGRRRVATGGAAPQATRNPWKEDSRLEIFGCGLCT